MSERRLVRGLIRGLQVLRTLNEHNYCTVLKLSRLTGLPRPTVYRLLETLMAAGYVTIGSRKETYQLTISVRALADGFDDEAWMTTIASPVLAELGREIVWPTDIATFDRDAMVLRETTHGSSPLSINRERPGFRVSLLRSALGQAFLAYSPPADQEMILRAIAVSGQPDAELATDRRAVDGIIAATLKRGYGLREGGISPKTGSIAVPVMWQDRPIACINMHYILSALIVEEVVRRYLGPLHWAARAIERELAGSGDLSPP